MTLYTCQGVFPISFEKTKDKIETLQNTALENKFFGGLNVITILVFEYQIHWKSYILDYDINYIIEIILFQ